MKFDSINFFKAEAPHQEECNNIVPVLQSATNRTFELGKC